MADARADALKAQLIYEDKRGWSLVNPRGVALYGPTWSMTALQRWARENAIDYRIESATAPEREEAAQPVEG